MKGRVMHGQQENKVTLIDFKHRSGWFEKFRDPWESWVKLIYNYVTYIEKVRMKHRCFLLLSFL